MKLNPSRDGHAAPQAVVAGAAAAAAMAARSAAAAEELRKEVPSALAAAFEKIPTTDTKVAHAVMAGLVKGGPATVSKLVALVGDEFGDLQGVKPKYALHGLVHYASRPGADAERKMVAETLGRQLQADHSDELKAFICRQLQLCGRPDEVPALGKLLESDRLCEPATQALLAIGGDKSTAAVRAALPGAKGKRLPTIVKALGRLKDKPSAGAIRKFIDNEDQDTRLMAWWALANTGDEGSVDALLEKSAAIDGRYERTQAVEACLLLARRLGEAGETAGAEKICRELIARFKSDADVHPRCAALAALAKATGVKAVGEVMAALSAKDVRYRHPAARTAVNLARAIQKSNAPDAEKLLNKVLDATEEKAVRIDAGLLLGKYNA
jgi:HEAT repeat protein